MAVERRRPSWRRTSFALAVCAVNLAGVFARGPASSTATVSVLWADIVLWLLLAALFALGGWLPRTRRMRQHAARALLLRLLQRGGVVAHRELNPKQIELGYLGVAGALRLQETRGFVIDWSQAARTIAASRTRIARILALTNRVNRDQVSRLRSYAPAAFVIDEMVGARQLVWVGDELAPGPSWSPYRH